MPPPPLLAVSVGSPFWTSFAQFGIEGLTFGMLIALIALGYTMVYGIVELINFAHGDLFMLGSFLALTILTMLQITSDSHWSIIAAGLALCFLLVPIFCAALNMSVDRFVYRPLRAAPKLAPLVSAIGVSFIFMNIGLFWGGPQDVSFPDLIPNDNLLSQNGSPTDSQASSQGNSRADSRADPRVDSPADSRGDFQGNFPGNFPGNTEAAKGLQFTGKNLLVLAVTIPLMIALTIFVRYTRLGKAMRATAQNPTAARLMGIHVDRVISVTFLIGGALAGFGSIIYGLTINTINYQMGFQNGLYAFTAAVLGGIGNIPGAVVGGLVIGLVRSYGCAYVGEQWTGALIFATLIVLLVFRPSGLLGARVRDKV